MKIGLWNGGDLDKEQWDEIHQELVRLINRFDNVFRKRVSTIRKSLIVSDTDLEMANAADLGFYAYIYFRKKRSNNIQTIAIEDSYVDDVGCWHRRPQL